MAQILSIAPIVGLAFAAPRIAAEAQLWKRWSNGEPLGVSQQAIAANRIQLIRVLAIALGPMAFGMLKTLPQSGLQYAINGLFYGRNRMPGQPNPPAMLPAFFKKAEKARASFKDFREGKMPPRPKP